MSTVDKNVITFDVSVDDGRVVSMQISKSFEDLTTPALDDFGVWQTQLANIFSQCSRGHQFGHKHKFGFVLAHPGVVKRNDVGVSDGLQNFDFVSNILGTLLSNLSYNINFSSGPLQALYCSCDVHEVHSMLLRILLRDQSPCVRP